MLFQYVLSLQEPLKVELPSQLVELVLVTHNYSEFKVYLFAINILENIASQLFIVIGNLMFILL